MTLDKLALNQPSKVLKVEGQDILVQRLMAIGFLPGTEIRVVQAAPFGDPIMIELNGWRISLRCKDAACIFVEPDKSNHLSNGI